VLKQPQYQPMPVEQQVMIIFAATQHYLDDVHVDKVPAWADAFSRFMSTRYPDIGKAIVTDKRLTDETNERLRNAISEFKAQYQG